MRVAVLALGLLGCTSIYGLGPTELADPPDIDFDDDEVVDLEDNCVETKNPTQADEDDDGIGDHCDNCPLVVNTAQLDGDMDDAGDACDPHPVTGGDCLVFFDSLADVNAFATRWMVHTNDPMADVVVEAGQVQITAGTNLYKAVLSRELANDRFEIMTLWDTTLPTIGAEVMTVSNLTITNPTFASGYMCSAFHSTNGAPEARVMALPGSVPTPDPYSSVPVGPRMLQRLYTTSSTGTPSVRCRVDHGVALAVATILNTATTADLTTGAPGVAVFEATATLRGVAIYRFDPSATCAGGEVR